MGGVTYAREGAVAVVTVNRPQVRNAMDVDAMDALGDAVKQASGDIASSAVRAVILTGAGADCFCAGGDLKSLHSIRSYDEAYAMSVRMQRVLLGLERLEAPVIAVLNGPALGGGGEIMLCTDVRVAEEHAYLTFKQLQMGVTCGWGGASRLARDVGPRRALSIMLEGARLEPVEARDLGLVDDVVPAGRGMERALQLAARYALMAPLAVKGMKRMLAREDVDMHREADIFARTWASRDHAEAVEAFFQKRPARWEGA